MQTSLPSDDRLPPSPLTDYVELLRALDKVVAKKEVVIDPARPSGLTAAALISLRDLILIRRELRSRKENGDTPHRENVAWAEAAKNYDEVIVTIMADSGRFL